MRTQRTASALPPLARACPLRPSSYPLSSSPWPATPTNAPFPSHRTLAAHDGLARNHSTTASRSPTATSNRRAAPAVGATVSSHVSGCCCSSSPLSLSREHDPRIEGEERAKGLLATVHCCHHYCLRYDVQIQGPWPRHGAWHAPGGCRARSWGRG